MGNSEAVARSGRQSPVTIAPSKRKAPPERNAARSRRLIAVLAPLILLSITLAVVIGPVEIAPLTVWEIVFGKVTGAEGNWSNAQANIVWLIRFPRVLLAGVVGAGLAVIGVVMQAVTRNPLADPFLLGISSGAALGAVSVLLIGVFAGLGIFALSVGAFLGAMLAFVLVFSLALQQGRLLPTRMILAGVAASFMFSSVTSFITLSDDSSGAARRVLFWMLGGLSGARWEDLTLPALALVLGIIYLMGQSRALNALIIGDETATTLGIDVHKLRRRLLVVTSLLTGLIIAVSGTIGFVGLMMPHIVRLIVGTDHRRVLPVSLLAGALYLIWVDVIARTLFAPEEIPVGIITSFCGAPFFLWLMRRSKGAL
ncbi:MAG: iron ABC transporter permease [Chloroflexota bacterium]|nr:iron ABC transporter permease [Chloroflexota bacterium]MDE2950699.1 iron ABC transporter permease [Chloroflexota bacterium]